MSKKKNVAQSEKMSKRKKTRFIIRTTKFNRWIFIHFTVAHWYSYLCSMADDSIDYVLF